MLATTLLVNGVFLFVATVAASAPQVTPAGRLCAALVALALVASLALLVLARLRRVPAWGASAMRALCIAVPLLWLIGSIATGVVSVQEVMFVLSVSLLAWATWRVFRLLQGRVPPA
jgi:hypothetical protein